MCDDRKMRRTLGLLAVLGAAAIGLVTTGPLPSSAESKVFLVSTIKTDEPVVFVTIDDGFRLDPAAAALIRRWNWPITSFVISPPLRKDFAWFADLGIHPVFGNHTRRHTLLEGLSREEQKKAICDGANDIERITGSRPVWLRPPHGAADAETFRAAAACGMKGVVLWHVSVNGTTISTVGNQPIRRGDIILLHYRTDLGESLAALKERLDAAGLGVASLDDYLPGPDPIKVPSAGCPVHFTESCLLRASS